ncbi:MAG: hypothetical protein J2P17_34615, partial [Mycobacterium sp.]|nr:hypothetical protein [Mycobacterium sp.]
MAVAAAIIVGGAVIYGLGSEAIHTFGPHDQQPTLTPAPTPTPTATPTAPPYPSSPQGIENQGLASQAQNADKTMLNDEQTALKDTTIDQMMTDAQKVDTDWTTEMGYLQQETNNIMTYLATPNLTPQDYTQAGTALQTLNLNALQAVGPMIQFGTQLAQAAANLQKHLDQVGNKK